MDGAPLAVPARAPTSTPRRSRRCTRRCDEVLGGALDHYEEVIGDTVPDKLPMPLQVHRRAGRAVPALRHAIEAIHFKDYVMRYCPRSRRAAGC